MRVADVAGRLVISGCLVLGAAALAGCHGSARDGSTPGPVSQFSVDPSAYAASRAASAASVAATAARGGDSKALPTPITPPPTPTLGPPPSTRITARPPGQPIIGSTTMAQPPVPSPAKVRPRPTATATPVPAPTAS